jgi:hypothetical protein
VSLTPISDEERIWALMKIDRVAEKMGYRTEVSHDKVSAYVPNYKEAVPDGKASLFDNPFETQHRNFKRELLAELGLYFVVVAIWTGLDIMAGNKKDAGIWDLLRSWFVIFIVMDWSKRVMRVGGLKWPGTVKDWFGRRLAKFPKPPKINLPKIQSFKSWRKKP